MRNDTVDPSRLACAAPRWRRLRALCAVFLTETCAQPAGFVLSLVLPSVVFVMNNVQYAGAALSRSQLPQVMDGAALYEAYIVAVSLWNTVGLRSLSLRKSGELRQLAYAAGSARMVLAANALAQLIITAAQLTVFTVLLALVARMIDFGMIAMILWGPLLGAAVCLPALCVIRLRLPVQAVSSGSVIALTVLFALAFTPVHGAGAWVAMLNPIRFLWRGMVLAPALLHGWTVNGIDVTVPALMVVAALYVLFGCTMLRDIDVRPKPAAAPNMQALAAVRSLMARHTSCMIVGVNGAGKTTLLETLAADVARHGNRGKSVGNPACELAYLPQDAAFPGGVTVRQMIGLYAAMGCGGAMPYAAALQDFRSRCLTGLEGRRFSLLSGGERQLVLTYCTLLLNRATYLLDEPLRGVDPAHVRDMTRLIRTVMDAGRTVVMVTHHVSSIRDFGNPAVVTLTATGCWSGCCSDLPASLGSDLRADLSTAM